MLSDKILPSPRHSIRLLVAIIFLGIAGGLAATEFSGGTTLVLPVKDGKVPKIDGALEDWDLRGQEPAFIADETAERMNTQWAFMADETALYVSAVTSLPGRPYSNPYNPTDKIWQGDLLQLRLTSDPELPYPLDFQRDQKSPRILHLSLWKNSETGVGYILIQRGTRLNLGKEINPPGSEIFVRDDGNNQCVVEAKIPWSALGVPDGKNPFGPGKPGTGVAETMWAQSGDSARTKLGFAKDGGVFSFNRPQTWGRMEYPAEAPAERLRPTMAAILADVAARRQSPAPADGVPIEVQVPEDGLFVSVNILGEKGEVLREVLTGERAKKGPLTARWDGRDAFGHALPPGPYRWGAYFHRGLEPEFMGTVGTSGTPPYPAAENRGGWGGDHSNPIGCLADATGIYLLWPIAEAGRPLLKVDYDGKVLYRKDPFSGGGFGPFYAMASDGKFVYLTRGNDKVFLARVDATTGNLVTWGAEELPEVPVYESAISTVPAASTPFAIESSPKKNLPPLADHSLAYSPNAFGIAAGAGKIFVANYTGNSIHVVDAQTGKALRTLECAGPRSLLFHTGNLYAVSYVSGQPGQVICFEKASGTGRAIIEKNLVAPFGLAIDKTGNYFVSDLGDSQQVKVFSKDGALLRTIGKSGGRPWQGAYDAQSLDLLAPAGLAIDHQDALIICESSPPKVISRLSQPDNKPINRWYGPGAYWNATWPMPDDPGHVFYTLTKALGRVRLAGPDGIGVPDTYWAPDRAGFPEMDELDSRYPQPQVLKADNGQLYLAKDAGAHEIYLFVGDILRPVAQWTFVGAKEPGNSVKKDHLRVWADANADGRIQPDEVTVVDRLADGSPLPPVVRSVASMHMERNGDLYFVTTQNSILRVPSSGFGEKGTISWKLGGITPAIAQVFPGLKSHPAGFRAGILGVDLDSKKQMYVAFNARLAGGTGSANFPDAETAKSMLRGMGHTSTTNAVKFLKFDPEGRLLWMAGRKATAGARAGEIYHFWNLAGLVGDNYVAGASEWGRITFYTHDGFFVQSIFNDPAASPPPGPYTFGGETSGGRIAFFPAKDEVWAYSTGRAFRVKGFEKGKVLGESRASGTVVLDQVYQLDAGGKLTESKPLELVPTKADPTKNAGAWKKIPASTIKKDSAELATVQLAYDANFLFGRIDVRDPSPLENKATQPELAFKWGDSVSLVLGPTRDAKEPGAGDLRILAAKIGGKPRLLAMKSVTSGNKKPFEYSTPSGGTISFQFVGEVPGGDINLELTTGGYVATFAVPRDFLEFPVEPGTTLRGDVEIRLSGQGQRGLQATSRNYLFTPDKPSTTMTDDIPTESRLYPEFWGPVEVK